MSRPSPTLTDRLLRHLATFGSGLDAALLSEGVRVTAQALMEAEVTTVIEAGHYERSDSRRTYRNGYRARSWAAGSGRVALHIPKLRNGSYYPAFLGSAAGVIEAFVQRALVEGVGVDDVNALAARLGLPPVADALCYDLTLTLDGLRARLHERPLVQPYPFVWLDVLDADTDGRLALALGIGHAGDVTLLDFALFGHDDEDWALFIARLIRRRLSGVDTAFGDDHRGLREAAVAWLPFATWRYSRAEHVARLIEQLQADSALVIAISDTQIHSNTQIHSDTRIHSNIPTPLEDGVARALCWAA